MSKYIGKIVYITKVYGTYLEWHDIGGRLHREGNPAIIDSRGLKAWWENGMMLRITS